MAPFIDTSVCFPPFTFLYAYHNPVRMDTPAVAVRAGSAGLHTAAVAAAAAAAAELGMEEHTAWECSAGTVKMSVLY